MTRPGMYPAPRTVANRVLEILRAEVQPSFAAALVRATSDDLALDVTDEELDRVSRALPAAAAGRPVADLDVTVAELIARDRADAAYRETVAALSGRAGTRSAGLTAAGLTSSGSGDPCSAVAGTALFLPDLDEPTALISVDRVTAAGVLAVVYQYGDRIGFLSAVDRAYHQLDSDELCIDDDDLQNRLYCYGERDDRIKSPERARLAAKVLGLRDADLPVGERPDTVIPSLINRLLDAINDNCDPGVFLQEVTPADAFRLESAARAVQVRLSASVTGLTALRIRDLQQQFAVARGILHDLAPYVRPLCRPTGTTGTQPVADEWVSVAALIGPQLADGSDLFEAARTARAWRTTFDWLIDSAESADAVATLSDDVCEAAAILRPTRQGWCRSVGPIRCPDLLPAG